MASIQSLKSKDTGKVSYRVQIRRKGHSESETFPNKKEAKAWAESVESAIREGRHFPHAAAKRTSFDKLATDYIDKVLPDFDENERRARTRHLTWWSEQFAGLTLADITSDKIADARDTLAASTYTRGKIRKNKKGEVTSEPTEFKRTGATVNRFIATLSAALTWGMKERKWLTQNPVKGITRKKEPKGRTRFLTDDERAALLEACGKTAWPALRTLVLMALVTGARRGEMTGLRWADVDLKAGTALLQKTKNDEARTLILKGSVLESLRLLKLQNSARSEFVFAHPNGLNESYRNFDHEWYAALEAAEIKNFRFHDLRHTTASMLAAEGRSLLEIADVLGHKTMAMVQRYAHLCVKHKTQVIESLVAVKGL